MNSTWIAMLAGNLADEESLRKYQAIAKEKILNGQTNRLFDELERITFDDEMELFAAEFQDFFDQIQERVKNKDESNPLLPQDEKRIKIWMMGIAATACQDLFDDSGEIDPRLLVLLDLKGYGKKINKADLVCAYIGSLMQQMMKEQEFIDRASASPNIFSSVCNYVNHNNYRNWALQEMKRQDIKNNDALIKPLKQLPVFSSIDKETAIKMGITSAVICFGFGLFKAYQTFSDHLDGVEVRKNQHFKI